MCPSYRVTRDEKHSTRGRARLLFEMLEGEVIRDGWRSDEVREALDLCLACKGCRTECPAGVDMATYKAEFLHHHYQGRPRPPLAYAAGLVVLLGPAWLGRSRRGEPSWADSSRGSPGSIQTATSRPSPRKPSVKHSPSPGEGGQGGGGRGGQRVRVRSSSGPTPSPTTSSRRSPTPPSRSSKPRGTASRSPAGPLLRPPALRLRHARPRPPPAPADPRPSCRPEIEAGVPARRPGAELRRRVPRRAASTSSPRTISHDASAAQTFTLAEFLAREGWEPPRQEGRAIVHGHCHHHSVMGMAADRTILERTGLDVEILDSGCCGMAGAFGFERDHYDGLDRLRGAGPAPTGPRGGSGDPGPRGRLQLPRADRPGHGAAGAPPGGSFGGRPPLIRDTRRAAKSTWSHLIAAPPGK